MKTTTWRGVMMIRDNKAFRGALPKFWQTRGERYRKQAYCTDPESVRDIYERVANRESLLSIGRRHGLYSQAIKTLVKFPANHTGVIMCTHTHDGIAETWAHEVEPVVDSPLWWCANHVIDANLTDARGNKGGRPVAMQSANWITGTLDCPECGGKLYTTHGKTPAGNLRTVKLRCNGTQKERLTCRRFAPVDASMVADAIDAMFSGDHTPVLAFQRVSGNAHELDELRAGLSRIQARLSATEDDDELDALVAERKRVKTRIEAFTIIPDSYDYAPTGQTVAGMWNGDVTIKRHMVKAVKNSWGLALAWHEGQWAIKIGADFKETTDADGIVDLGNGLCFRRSAA